MLEQATAQDVLAQLFGAYQTEIVDRAYHQLRTTDHVSRYRPAVLDAVRDLAQTGALLSAAERLTARREATSIAEAEALLREQLAVIRDGFETLDARLNALDDRHNRFVHAAVRAIELHLAASATTSGQLNALLERVLSHPEQGLEDDILALPALFDYAVWDGAASLATPARGPVPFVPAETVATALDPAEADAARATTLRQMANSWSPSRVRALAQHLLNGRPDALASELPLISANDLAGVIYLRHFAQAGLGYTIEPVADAWVERDGFKFHEFRVIASFKE